MEMFCPLDYLEYLANMIWLKQRVLLVWWLVQLKYWLDKYFEWSEEGRGFWEMLPFVLCTFPCVAIVFLHFMKLMMKVQQVRGFYESLFGLKQKSLRIPLGSVLSKLCSMCSHLEMQNMSSLWWWGEANLLEWCDTDKQLSSIPLLCHSHSSTEQGEKMWKKQLMGWDEDRDHSLITLCGEKQI